MSDKPEQIPGKSAEHTKVRIAMQGWEVEAEGTQEFVQSELPALMEKMSELQRAAAPGYVPAASRPSNSSSGAPLDDGLKLSHVSTNTIASLINATTGSDLVMAAMAHLTLVQHKDTIARHELLDEMKAARTFYKEVI